MADSTQQQAGEHETNHGAMDVGTKYEFNFQKTVQLTVPLDSMTQQLTHLKEVQNTDTEDVDKTYPEKTTAPIIITKAYCTTV
jgi:hypothetical protein